MASVPRTALFIVVAGLFFGLLHKAGDITLLGDQAEKLCSMDDDTTQYKYDMVGLETPTATGTLLRVFQTIVTGRLFGPIIRKAILNDNKFHSIRNMAIQSREPIAYMPLVRLTKEEYAVHEKLAKETSALDPLNKGITQNRKTSLYKSIEDYAAAYRNKTSDPVSVVKHVLQMQKTLQEKGLVLFTEVHESEIKLASEQSAARFKEGKPLSIFDGIPVAVKDEVDVEGYVTGYGRKPSDDRPKKTHSDITVERLKAAGAIIVGKTTMTEFGASPLGYNSHFKGPKNPYNLSRYSGGSSGGSAASVAAQLVPLAIGLDSGGSIRIPSSLCGTFGISPTYSRIPFNGEAANVMSMIHIGPIAATAADAALAYLLLSPPAQDHYYTNYYSLASPPPPPHLHGFNDIQSLKGLTVGVFWDYFADADPEIVEQNNKAIQTLAKLGATIKNITIPHMQTLRLAHVLAIATEMAELLEPYYQGVDEKPSPLEAATAIQVAIGLHMQGIDFVSANRIRGWAIKYFQKRIFSEVDIYITPTVPFVAPEIPEASLEGGMSNTPLVTKIMQFVFMANFVGFPSMSVPVGYDSATGLPIGLCLNAAHWEDALLLRVAHALEVHHLKRQAPTIQSLE